MIFTGEVCTYSGRPIVVDDKSPQIARCRKCGAPYQSQSWFAAGEKCVVLGCDGKAADIGPPKVKEAVGEVCPFLPPVVKREGEEAPAKCLKAKCMLYDGVEKRCSLGEIAYTLASVRQSGRQTRHLLTTAVGSSSKQTVHLLTALANSFRNTEKDMKALVPAQDKAAREFAGMAAALQDIKVAIEALSGDQAAAAQGFDRLAAAVEATGVGEQVRGRRDARLAARAALRDGRPGAAVNLLTKARGRGADEALANDLATAYVQADQTDEAQDVLQELVSTNADNTPGRITLATLKLRGGLAQEAEALLKDAPEPADPQLRAELAYAQACVAYAVGRSEDAVALLNQALDQDPWHSAAAAALQDLRARRVGASVPDAAAIAQQLAGVTAGPGEDESHG